MSAWAPASSGRSRRIAQDRGRLIAVTVQGHASVWPGKRYAGQRFGPAGLSGKAKANAELPSPSATSGISKLNEKSLRPSPVAPSKPPTRAIMAL